MATTFLNATRADEEPSSTGGYQVHARFKFRNQQGYSILELIIGMAVMLIISSAVVTLLKSAMTIATTSYEVTEAQESLRTAQEYINRDLMNAGDGLKSITYIPVNTAFVTNYLTRTPIPDGTMPAAATNLGILTTDNNLPSGSTAPAPQVAPSPAPTATPIPLFTNSDRQTILEIDPDVASNPQIIPASISAAGDLVTLLPATTAAQMATFAAGDIYFITSQRGGTFGAITNVDATNKRLTFGAGDFCGLNTAGANNRIKDISVNGTIPTTLQRMRIIQYFVDSNRLLKRRVFGERGAPFRDNTVAEHVLNVQFVYSLGLDSNGNPVQPTSLLTTPTEQVNISEVEVTVTVETPHVLLQNGVRPPPLSMTTSTSLRNMQFRQALQPTPTPTP